MTTYLKDNVVQLTISRSDHERVDLSYDNFTTHALINIYNHLVFRIFFK
jgi:hypothetical protein